jgi:hypothetical protein
MLLPSGALAQEEEELPPWLQDQDPEVPGESREEAQGPVDPMRLMLGAGFGTSIRLVEDDDLEQERFAPAFVDAMVGLVLPGRGSFRHGVAVNASINVTGDGRGEIGFDGGRQIVVSPQYVAHLGIGGVVPDAIFMAKGGPAFAVAPDFSPGIELSGAFAYMLFAGVGLYAELTFGLWFGADSSVHPLVSGELGFHIDYELLP